MATSQIQLTRSGTAGAQPSASELAQGELALNYADGKLFFKNSSNNIEQLNSTFNNSGGKIYVNEADNHIGLSTTSPAFLLDLGGTTPDDNNEIRINQESGTAIRIGASASTTTGIIRIDSGNGSSDDSTHGFSIDYNGGGAGDLNDALIISPDNGTGTAIQAFTLQQNGTIGMSKGTSFTPFSGVTLDVEDDIQVTGTNPTFRLHKTNGDDTHDQSWIAMGTNTTDNALEFQTRESDGTFKSNDYRIIKNASGALNHQWSIANDEKVRLDSTGLGIGLSPQRTLDVGGTGAIIRGNLYIGDPAQTQATSNMILFGTRDANQLDTLGMYANDKIVFRVGSNNEASEILILNQSGDTITAPNLDTTAINAGGNKSLVTKEYVTSQVNDFIPNIAQAISDKRMRSSQDLPPHDSALTAAFWPSNVLKETTDDRNWSDINQYPLYVSITPRRNNSKFRISVNATGGIQGDDSCGIIVSYNTGSYSHPGVPGGLSETIVGNDEGSANYRGVTLQLPGPDDGSDSYEVSGSWSGLWSPSISAGTTINFFLSLVGLNDDDDPIMFNSAYTGASSGHHNGTYPTNIMVEEIYTE